MEKSFFDVFPGLKLKTELQALLEDVIVTKVSCNAGKTQLRVYIKSSRWIHKKHIFEFGRSRSRDSASQGSSWVLL